MIRRRIVVLACGMIAIAVCGCTPVIGAAGGDSSPSPQERANQRSSASPGKSAKRYTESFQLKFDGADALDAKGNRPVRVRSLTRNGGRVRRESGVDGTKALRFPRYTAGLNGARLVLLASAKGERDWLNPGKNDFRLGADIKLDAKSDGDGQDNGDNIVQRGLYSGTNQYKLQVDHRQPSCRIHTSQGGRFVKLDTKVSTDWTRLVCERRAGKLTITASRMSHGHPTRSDRSSVAAPPERFTFDSSVPLAIGGKISHAHKLVMKQSDQFNGRADNIFVTIFQPADRRTE